MLLGASGFFSGPDLAKLQRRSRATALDLRRHASLCLAHVSSTARLLSGCVAPAFSPDPDHAKCSRHTPLSRPKKERTGIKGSRKERRGERDHLIMQAPLSGPDQLSPTSSSIFVLKPSRRPGHRSHVSLPTQTLPVAVTTAHPSPSTHGLRVSNLAFGVAHTTQYTLHDQH